MFGCFSEWLYFKEKFQIKKKVALKTSNLQLLKVVLEINKMQNSKSDSLNSSTYLLYECTGNQLVNTERIPKCQ